jgi:hypothetical protein
VVVPLGSWLAAFVVSQCVVDIRCRLMQAAFDNAVEYVHDRKQFGQPVGTFQLMQGKTGFAVLVLCSSDPFFSEDRRHVHETERKSILRICCRKGVRPGSS